VSFAQPAAADRGVAVSLGRIELERPLDKGRSYTLPTLSVINPGDEPSGYRLAVNYIGDQTQQKPPADWFEFSDESVQLPPGQSKPVTIRLRIPTDARPGEYQALLEAALTGDVGQGAAVGAAAAARLTFDVRAAGWLDARWNQVKQFFSDASPWPQLIALAGALGGLGWALSRRFTLSVGRR
jgi:hypothetical protein